MASNRSQRATRFVVRISGADPRRTGAMLPSLKMVWRVDSFFSIDGGTGLLTSGDGHLWEDQTAQQIADRLGRAVLQNDPNAQVEVIVQDLEPVDIGTFRYGRS